MTPKKKKHNPRIQCKDTNGKLISGVYYREVARVGGNGTERMYYITYKKDGKMKEEKAGRQYADNMTVAKARDFRSDRIRGNVLSHKEKREKRILEEERKKAEKLEEENKMTLDRLWKKYLESKGEEFAKKTADKSRYEKHLQGEYGDKEVHEITAWSVDKLKRRLEKKYSDQSVQHILELLRRLCNFGKKKNLSAPLPFTIEMPKVDNETTEHLTADELKRLLNAIQEDEDQEVGRMMLLALYTGMRRGEIFKLKWNDIDNETSFIHIRASKGGKDQKIPLNKGAQKVLADQPKMANSQFVFPGRGGGQRTNIRNVANRIKTRAELPEDFRPMHGLRHAYASMLASSGKVDLYTLQKLLTHKSTAMTQRYAHIVDKALKRGADVADDIINSAINGD